jgi:hypothetical protein
MKSKFVFERIGNGNFILSLLNLSDEVFHLCLQVMTVSLKLWDGHHLCHFLDIMVGIILNHFQKNKTILFLSDHAVNKMYEFKLRARIPVLN